jgi:hypothetical protein
MIGHGSVVRSYLRPFVEKGRNMEEEHFVKNDL